MTTVTARGFVSFSYNFVDFSDTGAVISDAANIASAIDMSYGSGVSEITLAVSNTGYLSSGSSINIDVRNLPKNILTYTSTASITGVKGFCIVNNSTDSSGNIAIRCTGTNAFTNLFNGGSGNIIVRPSAAFMYIDPYGIPATTGNKNFQIVNVGNSGVSYTYSIFGN